MKKGLLFFLVSALGLIGSSVHAASPVACTMQYDPVCGSVIENGQSVQKTFGNSCMAGAAQASDIIAGECSPAIGGNTDTHGCLTSAGYSWDTTLSQCVRPWEQGYLVSWANKIGLTRYADAQSFGFDRDISRGEAAAMIARFIEPTRGPAGRCPFEYTDASTFDPSLINDIYAACGYVVMQGNNRVFDAQNVLTHAEAIALIIRAIDKNTKDESLTPWYSLYLARMTELDIIPNLDENVMNTPITRGEFLQWLNDTVRFLAKSTDTDASLLGTWSLVSLNGVSTSTDTSTQNITLTFDGDRISTRICNNMSGNYSVANGVISAPVMASTLMACQGKLSDIETAFTPDGAKYTVRTVRSGDGPSAPMITLLTITTKTGNIFTYKMDQSKNTVNILGDWKLVEYDTTSWDTVKSKNYQNLGLSFTRDRLSAKLCNSISGTYTLSGNTLTTSGLAMTRMFCSDPLLMEMENNFHLDGATVSVEQRQYLVATDMPSNLLIIKTKDGHTYTYGK